MCHVFCDRCKKNGVQHYLAATAVILYACNPADTDPSPYNFVMFSWMNVLVVSRHFATLPQTHIPHRLCHNLLFLSAGYAKFTPRNFGSSAKKTLKNDYFEHAHRHNNIRSLNWPPTGWLKPLLPKIQFYEKQAIFGQDQPCGTFKRQFIVFAA